MKRGLLHVRSAFNLKTLVLVGLCLVALVILLIVRPPFLFGYTHVKTKRGADLGNIKQIGIAHLLYMEDYDGYGPPPDQWMDALLPILKNESILFSPLENRADGEYGYAYLRGLQAIRLSGVLNPGTTPTVFNSSDLRRNANGSLGLLPYPPRWDGIVNNIVFLDGHAKGYRETPKFEIEIAENLAE